MYNINIKQLSVLFVILAVVGCSSAQDKQQRYSEKKLLMATFVQVDVCMDEANQDKITLAYQDIWDRLEDIAWRMNVYDEKSDLAKINNAQGQEVEIGEDTYGLIKDSIEMNKKTKGVFDITIWPLMKLWKNAGKVNKLPTQEELASARSKVGVGHISLGEENKIAVTAGTMIDLGGIGKGYAVDEAARILREYEIKQFYIDAGGNIYVGGLNCEGQPWSIGIRNPKKTNQIMEVVLLENKGVSTSGNYEQFFDVENKRYSHIINPVTGMPQENIISATVIAPTAQDADGLSTALCILNLEEGRALIDQLGEGYASLSITEHAVNGSVKFPSKNYIKYQKIN